MTDSNFSLKKKKLLAPKHIKKKRDVFVLKPACCYRAIITGGS